MEAPNRAPGKFEHCIWIFGDGHAATEEKTVDFPYSGDGSSSLKIFRVPIPK